MKRWNLYSVAGLIFAVGGAVAYYGWAEEDYQRCADTVRQEDMFAIAQMVEDYQETAGHYPFQTTDETVTEALLASRDLSEIERRGPPGDPMTIIDKDVFYDEVARVLGAKQVKRLADPQKVAVSAPNFYQYRVYSGGYSISVNLYNPVPQSVELGPNYHKLQVGSEYDPDQKIYPFLQVPVGSILAASQAVAEHCN